MIADIKKFVNSLKEINLDIEFRQNTLIISYINRRSNFGINFAIIFFLISGLIKIAINPNSLWGYILLVLVIVALIMQFGNKSDNSTPDIEGVEISERGILIKKKNIGNKFFSKEDIGSIEIITSKENRSLIMHIAIKKEMKIFKIISVKYDRKKQVEETIEELKNLISVYLNGIQEEE